MASDFYLSFFMVILLHNIWIIHSSAAVSYCWHGNIESQRTLKNETCATGKISLPDIRDQISHTTHTPLLPQNLTQVTAGAGVAPSLSTVTHCMVFQYMKHTELGAEDDYKTYETSIFANYTCDYSGLCHGSENGWQYNVTHRGVHGNVYCCDTNNCNNHVQGVPPKQQLCYEASNAGNTLTGKLISCMASGAVCANATWIQHGERVSLYFCDNLYRCQTNGLTGKYDTCKKVQRDGTNQTEELCCCQKNKCNIPPWPIADQLSDGANTGTSTALQWIIAGSIILLTFCVGVGAGVAVAVIRKQRKSRGDNHMAMTYRRISADDAVLTRDDEHLIT